MAYQFDLETEPPEPFTDNMGTEIIEFALGYDVEANCAHVMSVMLVPINDAHDVRFGIRTRDITSEWRVSAPDYGIEAVRNCVPKDQRAPVLELLLGAVVTLLNRVNPDVVTMETAFPYLDDVAMTKYDRIKEKIEGQGFVTKEEFRSATDGRNYWLFHRPIEID